FMASHIKALRHYQKRDNQGNPVLAKKPVAYYDYTDGGGRLLYQVVRYEPKTFRIRRPTGGTDGIPSAWRWGLGQTACVLYRLPGIKQARHTESPVYLVEGEKDADRLAGLGLVATTSPMGAAN